MANNKNQPKPKSEDGLSKFFGDRFHKNVFLICLFTSVGLLIAGFVTPPMWIIDRSVLWAVAELFGFAALGIFGYAIEKGRKAKISHGNTSIEIRSAGNHHHEESYDD